MGFDLFVGDVQHDVAEQVALPHPVHGYEGVVVVALGVVRDAVAITVEQLHAPLHHGAWRGCSRLLPGPHSGQLQHAEGHSVSVNINRVTFASSNPTHVILFENKSCLCHQKSLGPERHLLICCHTSVVKGVITYHCN